MSNNIVEHYRKVSSQYIEDAPLPNEIRVLSSARITELISQIIRTMNVCMYMCDNVIICVYARKIWKRVWLFQHVEVM